MSTSELVTLRTRATPCVVSARSVMRWIAEMYSGVSWSLSSTAISRSALCGRAGRPDVSTT
jgi:hypothetical protein